MRCRYKREAYRGSEFAPRVLANHGLRVVMKVSDTSRTEFLLFLTRNIVQSDHPVLDSRFLLYEAQQAFLYGLPDNLALAAVTR